ncbi:hypothetical protein L53_04240 [Hyphomonas sp. L-53-1-40]|nr:hypothetical protein L53_04240 [Hyphomonas sp. L-53-1-40]
MLIKQIIIILRLAENGLPLRQFTELFVKLLISHEKI